MGYNWKRNTIAFLSGQAISIFGSSLVQYAMTWHITLTTKSGLFTMLSIICGFLPTFFLSPFAGVWADRYDRKKLIIIADGGIAVATLIVAVVFMTGNGSVWVLLAAMAIRGLGSAVQQPCINAILPDIVPTEHLTRVNGINGSLNSLITLVSPMLSGALMGFAPLQVIFFIDVVTAALAICVMLFTFRLPEKEEKPKAESGQYLAEMKQGFSYIFKHRYLRNFFGFCVALWLLTGPVAFLTPLQAARNYGDDVWRLTAVEVAFSVGMLIGGLTISAWGGLKNRILTVAFTGMIMAAAIVVLGISMPFWLYIGILVAIGLAMPIFNTPAIVFLQERIDPGYIGRIFSIMTMLSSSLMPMSMLAYGPLADAVPIEYLLIGTGILLAFFCVLMAKNKPLVSVGSQPIPVRQNASPDESVGIAELQTETELQAETELQTEL